MEQNGKSTPRGNSERQALALPFLAYASSLSKGARIADIGRTTLHCWIRDQAFRDQLQGMRKEAADLAGAELQGLMLKSVLVLAEALDDESAKVRFCAASSTLQVALQDDEARSFRHRLNVLGDALALLKRQI